uniref:molybdopterin adenylyltransferase n=1 Tax=Globodera rostochiensis TaxID=31243 RepID=A0A914GX88_GLORO
MHNNRRTWGGGVHKTCTTTDGHRSTIGGSPSAENSSMASTSHRPSSVIHRHRKSPWPAVPITSACQIVQEQFEDAIDKLRHIEQREANAPELLGAVLAESVHALEAVPDFRASIKDGYAVIASDGLGPRRVVAASTAGTDCDTRGMGVGECVRVTTGARVPLGADAVMQVEDTRVLEHNGEEELVVEIGKEPLEGQDIREPGSDVAKGELLLKKGTVLNAAEIGVIALSGAKKVRIYERSVPVSVLSTGDELIDFYSSDDRPRRVGAVMDTNRPVLISFLRSNGFRPVDMGVVGDSLFSLIDIVRRALTRTDVLVVTGGVSMGEKDLLKEVFPAFRRLSPRAASSPPALPTQQNLCSPSPGIRFPPSSRPIFLCCPNYLRRIAGMDSGWDNARIPIKIAQAIGPLDARPEYRRARLVRLSSVSADGLAFAECIGGSQCSSRLCSALSANLLLELPPRDERRETMAEGETVTALVIGPLTEHIPVTITAELSWSLQKCWKRLPDFSAAAYTHKSVISRHCLYLMLKFGGGGWGDQGEQEFAASQVQKNIYDKIPLPAAIDVLINMSGDEEKYALGNYSFNTVQLMGKVANVSSGVDQCTTYELCDALATDVRIAKRFSVIRYTTADLHRVKEEVFAIGQLVHVIGKLRLFNNRLSVVCFNIREVEMEEIAVYNLECKLAKIYFEKNLPEYSLGIVENDTVFHGKTSAQNAGASMAHSLGGTLATPNRKAPSHWTPQQQRIYEFIKHNAIGEAGVHKEVIKSALGLNASCSTDLVILSNEGAIYATIDDDHFRSIISFGYLVIIYYSLNSFARFLLFLAKLIASEGERSLREGDAGNGIKALERALQCDSEDLALQSSLHSQLGNAYYARGDYEKARLHHMSDLYASRIQRDELQQAKAWSNLSATYTLLLDFDNAIDCANNVVNFAKKIGDKSLECRGLYSLGLAHLHCATRGVAESYDEEQLTKYLERSVECFEMHLAIARERQDRVLCGLGLGNLGNAYFYLGEYELSIEQHEKRIELAKELGDQSSVRRSYSNIGNAYALLGDYENSAKFYRLALELACEMNIPELVNQLNDDLENVCHILAKEGKKFDDLPTKQFADVTCTSGGVNSSFGTESTNFCLSDVTILDEQTDRDDIFDQIARLNGKRIVDQLADFKPTSRDASSLKDNVSNGCRFSFTKKRIGNMMKSLSNLKKIGTGTTPKRGGNQQGCDSATTSADNRPKSTSSLKGGLGKMTKSEIKLEF